MEARYRLRFSNKCLTIGLFLDGYKIATKQKHLVEGPLKWSKLPINGQRLL